MKIKLPRKRKKRCIKAIGWADYTGCVILNEILFEQKPVKKSTKFPHYNLKGNTPVLMFNW